MNRTTYLALKYLAVLVWSAFVVLPFLWMLTTSFKTANGVTGGATWVPWLQYEPSTAGWKSLFGGAGGINIVRPYINSVVVTLSASALSLVLGTLAAYGLSRFTFRAGPIKNGDITFFFISQRIMPPIVLAIPFFLMLKTFGLLDTLPGLILVYIALLLPIAVWVMVDFFNSVPRGLDEMEVRFEVTPEMFSDRVAQLEQLQRQICQALDHTLGIRVKVTLVEPNTIQRSEGKARRVLDQRES